MCAETGSGLHVQCTERTGVTKLTGTFLQLPVENWHVVYAVQVEVPVLRIAIEIHKQSFTTVQRERDATEGLSICSKAPSFSGLTV